MIDKTIVFFICAMVFISRASTCWADWSLTSQNVAPSPQALVGGRDDGGQPLYLCRARYLGSWQVGKTRAGINGCDFGYGGRERVIPAYQYWTASWAVGAGKIPQTAIVTSGELISNALIPRYSCLGFIDLYRSRSGRDAYFPYILVPGKTGPGISGCLFPYGGVERQSPGFQVLADPLGNIGSKGAGPFNSVGWYVIQAHTGDQNLPYDAVLGGFDIDRKPLYLCSAAYVDGFHPGKVGVGLGGCHISYGGKEIVETSYVVLVPDWTPQTGSDFSCANGQLMNGVCQARTRAIAAGTDTNGDTLYFCRAKVGAGVHPGRLKAALGGCSVGYGGKEVVRANYELLTDGYDPPPGSH